MRPTVSKATTVRRRVADFNWKPVDVDGTACPRLENRYYPYAIVRNFRTRPVAKWQHPGGTDETYRTARALMRDGFYTNSAAFPAVSQGHGGLRVALTLHQTRDDIRALVTAIAHRLRATR